MHGRGPLGAGMIGVGEDRVPDLLRPAPLFQDGRPFHGVFAGIRVPLEVVVVQEAGDRPGFRVAAVAGGVGPHRAFDAQSVLDQAGVLGELGQDRPGVIPCLRHGPGVYRIVAVNR